eukprot:s4690_g4.t1
MDLSFAEQVQVVQATDLLITLRLSLAKWEAAVSIVLGADRCRGGLCSSAPPGSNVRAQLVFGVLLGFKSCVWEKTATENFDLLRIMHRGAHPRKSRGKKPGC